MTKKQSKEKVDSPQDGVVEQTKAEVGKLETTLKEELEAKKLEEKRQDNLRDKYDAGTLSGQELDEDYTIPQILEYADIHDLHVSRSANKGDLIVQVLKKETNEDFQRGLNISVEIANVRNIRSYIDRSIRFVGRLPIDNIVVSEHLFMSRAWLGKLLGYMGSKNPYNTKEVVTMKQQIPPTSDVFEDDISQELYQFSILNHIEAIYKLRDIVNSIKDDIECIDLSSIDKESGRTAAICKTQSWVFANQANFELGKTLGKLRDN